LMLTPWTGRRSTPKQPSGIHPGQPFYRPVIREPRVGPRRQWIGLPQHRGGAQDSGPAGSDWRYLWRHSAAGRGDPAHGCRQCASPGHFSTAVFRFFNRVNALFLAVNCVSTQEKTQDLVKRRAAEGKTGRHRGKTATHTETAFFTDVNRLLTRENAGNRSGKTVFTREKPVFLQVSAVSTCVHAFSTPKKRRNLRVIPAPGPTGKRAGTKGSLHALKYPVTDRLRATGRGPLSLHLGAPIQALVPRA